MAHTATLIPQALLLLSMAASLGPVTARPAGLTSNGSASASSSSECWESLFALRACTSEVILFFMNGETYLSQGCCDAVRSIQHHCWSHSVFGLLGLTTEEFDILRGFCDATANDTDSAPPPPPSSVTPAPSPQPTSALTTP